MSINNNLIYLLFNKLIFYINTFFCRIFIYKNPKFNPKGLITYYYNA